MADLEFLHGKHFPQCDSVVNKRFDDYCSLQVITAGAVEIHYDQRVIILDRPFVFLSYPGPWIRTERAPGHLWWEHRYIAFRGPLMSRWMDSALLPLEPQRIPESGGFVQRFDELLALFTRTDRLGQSRSRNLLEGLLLALADERRPAEMQWLDRARELLLQLPVWRPDYASVAAELGMGLSTFRRAFRAAAGVSAHQFLLRERIDTACHLLSETELPPKRIARELGYRDVFYFTRQFKRLTGVSPAQYRRQLSR